MAAQWNDGHAFQIFPSLQGRYGFRVGMPYGNGRSVLSGLSCGQREIGQNGRHAAGIVQKNRSRRADDAHLTAAGEKPRLRMRHAVENEVAPPGLVAGNDAAGTVGAGQG